MRKLLRLLKIKLVFFRNGLDEIICQNSLLEKLYIFFKLNPLHWIYNKNYKNIPRGERVKNSLEELGPIFIKFGQLLATRRDIIPNDIASQLALLQDRVRPFPEEIAKITIEKAFKTKIGDLFASFDLKPLACASIAQVHAAKLKTGEDVVVKVLRPKIKKLIKRDISLLYILAKSLEKFSEYGRRFQSIAIVREFEQTLLNELNLLQEAANASQLKRNFQDSSLLYIPKIYWDYCHKKVIVIERIYGIPINDLAALKAHNINMKELAERTVKIFFTQAFRDCFFHADMHAGNIFICPIEPKNPKYITVDFGIVGSLSRNDQHYLAYNFLAFFRRDYRRVAELHVESGWLPKNTRLEDFETAIRTVSEPIFEKPLKEISFGSMLLQLFQTAKKFNIEIQPQLILLQKTLLSIEGLGRQLYPELNLWDTAKPFLEEWIKEQTSPRMLTKKFFKDSNFWAIRITQLPEIILKTVEDYPKIQNQAQFTLKKVEILEKQIAKQNNQLLIINIIIAASLLGSLLILLS